MDRKFDRALLRIPRLRSFPVSALSSGLVHVDIRPVFYALIFDRDYPAESRLPDGTSLDAIRL